MSNIHDVRSYSVSSDDVLFFDNNIWMYLFCPIANARKGKQKEYSSLLNRARSARAGIWINSLVLSEFCNAWLQIEFRNWKKQVENIAKHSFKKDFIPTSDYKQTVSEIKESVSTILSIAEPAPDDFTSINIDAVFAEFENSGFNDSYYLELAHKNNWKIVTDDADFFKNRSLKVEIITANLK